MFRFVAISVLVSIGFVEASRTKVNSLDVLKADLTRTPVHTRAKAATPGGTPLTGEERETNRASLGFVYGLTQIKGKSYKETFCSRSNQNEKGERLCDTVDGFPGANSHSELRFDKIVADLMTIPEREEQGKIRRLGDLGYFIFNDLLWSKDWKDDDGMMHPDWKTFPIGADFEDHHKHRATADRLMGQGEAWTRKMIRDHVKDFFKGRTSMKDADYGRFVTKLFHKILLDMELDEVQLDDFMSYKSSSMMVSLLPRWLVSGLRWAMSLSTAQENRLLWLEKYEAAMKEDTRGIIPTFADRRDRRFLADLLLTAMTSAGGLSVPTVMSMVIGIVYGAKNSDGEVVLPEDERTMTKDNIRRMIYETVRRYPVVVGFPSWSPDMSKRLVLNLALGLRDERKWEDPETFKLRKLSDYHDRAGSGSNIGLAWAEQGKGPEGLTPDSRGCPGQELSIVIIEEFLSELSTMQTEWTVTEMGKKGITITEGPSAASAFTLSRGSTEEATIVDTEPEREPTTDEEVAEMMASLASGATNQLRKPGRFQCPIECQECCKQVSSWSPVLWRQDKTSFKCVMPREFDRWGVMPDFKIAGRSCTEPTPRNSDPQLAKAKCDLTKAEQTRELYNDLPKCTYEPIIQTYDEFLGSKRWKDYCAVSYTGTLFGVHAIGEAINRMFFRIKEPITGGVCGSKASALFKGGLLNDVCEEANVAHDQCKDHQKEWICNKLDTDYKAGRVDDVSLALWAGAVGPLRVMKEFPKPSGPIRKLRKFNIPGWGGRSVAYEMPEHDLGMDLMGGAFQCMMKKLKSYNSVDDELFDPNRNVYGAGYDTPISNADVNQAFFGRYGIYAKPLHFVVPLGEMQSDATLEKLVFEAIGAHRVEPIQDGHVVNLNPITIPGLPTAALPGSPGLLDALPADLQQKARFIVRLEGLFDKMPVREGMQGWGGNAFFDAKGKLMALQYRGETIVEPVAGGADSQWEQFKFIFRSSLVSTVTAFDHLVSTHILASESLSVATVETLPAFHGLRRLLTPHTWGSLKINMQAATNLFAKNMLVHRASPFDAEAFEGEDGSDGLLWQMIPLLRYTTFLDSYAKYADHRVNSDGPEIPFFEDGHLLHGALFQYVQSFVHSIYGTDPLQCDAKLQDDQRAAHFVTNFFESNAATPLFWPENYRLASESCGNLVALLSEVIFLVTGWHRHVGTVMDFFRDTRFAATSWKEGEHEARPKQSMMMMLLAATTNADLPHLEDDLADIYSRDVAFSGLFHELHTSMQAVQIEVEGRNAKRAEAGHMAFHQMEPRYVEWGVEV